MLRRAQRSFGMTVSHAQDDVVCVARIREPCLRKQGFLDCARNDEARIRCLQRGVTTGILRSTLERDFLSMQQHKTQKRKQTKRFFLFAS